MTIPNVSMLFVVPVVVAAVNFGLGASIFSAVVGALAYNFFLTEPRYSLTVDDPAYIWAIALLFIVGLVVSTVAFTSRRRAAEASLLRRQVTVLRDYGRDIAAAGNQASVASITARLLAALFQVPAVVLLEKDGNIVSRAQARGAELQARSSLTTRAVVRAGVYLDVTSSFDFWAVVTTSGPSAVMGLAFDPDERPATPGELVDVVGNTLALVLERRQADNTGT